MLAARRRRIIICFPQVEIEADRSAS